MGIEICRVHRPTSLGDYLGTRYEWRCYHPSPAYRGVWAMPFGMPWPVLLRRRLAGQASWREQTEPARLRWTGYQR